MPERILVAVITGGRPLLADRITTRFLPALSNLGWDIVWVMRADHVAEYETDEHPIEAYTVEWADRYASSHWRHPLTKFEPGGFHGAFTGREWAMRLGAKGGYDAVLQLDDNLSTFGPLSANQQSTLRPDAGTTTEQMFMVMLDLAFSTNVSMCGMQLDSVPAPEHPRIIRPGFPYSAFIEKVKSTRVPYYGPFEDDIMHALDYGLSIAPITAAVIETLKYSKKAGGQTGMRARYDSSRGLELARRYPRNVRLGPGTRTSSMKDLERGFRHFLSTKGFTAVQVTDRSRYDLAVAALTKIVRNSQMITQQFKQIKMEDRAKG